MDALVPDDLWAVAEPLLPPEPQKPKGGRRRASVTRSQSVRLATIRLIQRYGARPHSAETLMGGDACDSYGRALARLSPSFAVMRRQSSAVICSSARSIRVPSTIGMQSAQSGSGQAISLTCRDS